MILWVWFALVSANENHCPEICSCSYQDGNLAVDCSEKALTSLSEIVLPADTVTLDLQSNNFLSVPSLRSVPKLRKVNLARNNLRELLDGDFSMLLELEEIDLSENEDLVFVGEYSFFSLPKLKRVNFESCEKLMWLSYRAFYDSYSLQVLNLKSTSLYGLSEDILIYAPNLKTISLEDVRLDCDCYNSWLASSDRVISSIQCSNESTECAPKLVPIYSREENEEGLVEAKQGQTKTLVCAVLGTSIVSTQLVGPEGSPVGRKGVLKLRSPMIKDKGSYECISSNAFGTDTYKFNMVVSKHTAEPNMPPVTQFQDFLAAESEELTILSEEYYDSSPELISTNASETIDLSPAFTLDVDLGDNLEAAGEAEWDRTTFPEDNFEQEEPELNRKVRYDWRTKTCPVGCTCTIDGLRAKKVECRNTDLLKVSQQPPADLTILDLVNTTVDLREINLLRDSVQIIKLRDTPYPALNEEDLDGFVNIRELRVINTGLMEIAMDTFRSLTQLRQLHLGQNELVRIPAEIFENMTSLESFALDQNPLVVLDRDSFSHFVHLKKLNLIGSSLDDFPPLLTEHNLNLEQLWLDDNDLVLVPDFKHLQRLRSVRLSANKIEYIQSEAFYKMQFLQELYLDDLPFLTMIGPRSFVDLPLLVDLEMSGCRKLSFIHQNAFENLPSLRLLSLADNALFTVGEGIYQSLPSLRIMAVQGNPLQCDCSINWMTTAPIEEAKCIKEGDQVVIIKDSKDKWSCNPVLHMPSLRHDNVYQEYENETVRIGCFSSDSGKVHISSKDGVRQTNENILSFRATPEDAGQFTCSSGSMSQKFELQIIGLDDEIHKGDLTNDIVEPEEDSGSVLFTASKAILLLLVLL